MDSELEKLKTILHQYGENMDVKKKVVEVNSTACIDLNIPASQGVYWIETTMPVGKMQSAISEVFGKKKKIKEKPPRGTSLIEQQGDDFYVAYLGTEENMKKRLKQHLFNQGHSKTIKLGCIIDKEPFSQYKWRVNFVSIESYEIRYAVEMWWRLNKGWPKFCLR